VIRSFQATYVLTPIQGIIVFNLFLVGIGLFWHFFGQWYDRRKGVQILNGKVMMAVVLFTGLIINTILVASLLREQNA